jgi:hypothetical protein
VPETASIHLFFSFSFVFCCLDSISLTLLGLLALQAQFVFFFLVWDCIGIASQRRSVLQAAGLKFHFGYSQASCPPTPFVLSRASILFVLIRERPTVI